MALPFRLRSSSCVALRAMSLLLVPAALLGQGLQTVAAPQSNTIVPAAPQPPRDVQLPGMQTGTGVIRGRVLRADTDGPLVHAEVDLTGTAIREMPRSASTNERGEYEFSRLPAGTYTVYVRKAGYVGLYYGRRDARNTAAVPIALADRQVLESIDVSLQRSAVIEGRVIDQHGDPVQDVRVESMRRRYVSGERVLRKDEGRSATASDDLGRFRIYNLDAGPHYLSVVQDALPETDRRSPMFYPGTFSPSDAQPIVVTAGQEHVGVVIQLATVRHATVSGSVALSNGRAATLTSVTLSNGVSQRALSPVRLAKGSTFSVPNVAPGDYVLTVQTEAREARITPITVSSTDIVLALTTTVGATVRGRIVFDGPQTNVRPADVRLSFTAAPAFAGDSPQIADDWTFEAQYLSGAGVLRAAPSVAALRAGQSGGWMLKSVVHRGTDVTDTPLDFTADVSDIDVVLTTSVSGVAGVVIRERRGPVPDATVVVFPDDQQRWGGLSRFVKIARSDQSGRFSLTGLPPGRYFAAAVDFVEEGDEQDPQILEALRRTALPVTLGPGEMQSVDLRLNP